MLATTFFAPSLVELASLLSWCQTGGVTLSFADLFDLDPRQPFAFVG